MNRAPVTERFTETPGTGQGGEPKDIRVQGAVEDSAEAADPCWIPCPHCDEFWCTIHNQHAFECPCPPIEDWGEANPYRDTPEQAAARKSHQDAP